MKHYIKQIIKNPLFTGSAVMIVGSNATNFLNYIYHLIIGRMLGPVNYSELAAIFSLIGLAAMVPASFGPVIVKFISASKTDVQITTLISWFNKKIFLFAGVITLLVLLISAPLSSFLQIENKMLIAVSSLVFLFMIPAVLNRGVLQGLLRFKSMVTSILAENSIRLISGVSFIYLGFSVFGATIGLVLAAFIGFLLSRLFIRDYFKKEPESKPDIAPMLRYSFPVVIQSVAVTSLYSTDVLLVKHFFSPHDAGIYAALSTLGKIIFFGAGPISAVMFPLVSKRESEGENYTKIFIYSLVLTILLSSGILFIYWMFPKFTISILYGASYLEAAGLLVWFGVFIALFTLCSLLIHFYLSLGKVKVVLLPLIAALAQILGIFTYHDSLKTVITVSITVTALLLVGLLIYLRYAAKVNFSNRPDL